MPPHSAGLKKRSVRIAGHNTSITMEDEFWVALRHIASARHMSLNALVTEIDSKNEGNLSSAIRVYILRNIQDRLSNALSK